MDQSNLPYLITSVFYYAIVAVLAILSAFSVYILIRYGKNVLVSMTVGVFYAIIFLGLLQQSLSTLQSLPH